MMKSQIISILSCGLLVCCGSFGQVKNDYAVKIVCPAMRSPKMVKMVRPIYPEAAKQAHIEGTVLLTCLIAVDGSVKRIEAAEGRELFVSAARQAILQWKYEPVKLNGKAVEVTTTVRVIFQIPKEKHNSKEAVAATPSKYR